MFFKGRYPVLPKVSAITMKKVQIIIDEIENNPGSFGIWSIIYLQMDSVCFPDDRWWDASSSVLSMWANCLCGFLCGSADKTELLFMDGSYGMVLKNNGKHEAAATLTKSDKAASGEFSMDVLYFVRQVLAASEKIIKSYTAAGQVLPVQELIRSCEKLRMVYKNTIKQGKVP